MACIGILLLLFLLVPAHTTALGIFSLGWYCLPAVLCNKTWFFATGNAVPKNKNINGDQELLTSFHVKHGNPHTTFNSFSVM
ncbi:hypothetical protein C0J52_00432 [Blattella germanica]|nr:hypothetical protein C0J52_00432 [Blattella germanica]